MCIVLLLYHVKKLIIKTRSSPIGSSVPVAKVTFMEFWKAAAATAAVAAARSKFQLRSTKLATMTAVATKMPTQRVAHAHRASAVFDGMRRRYINAGMINADKEPTAVAEAVIKPHRQKRFHRVG